MFDVLPGELFEPVVGIYQIRCTVTDRSYIGQSIRVQLRIAQHFVDLAEGKHSSIGMQCDWDRFGAKSFEARIVKVLNDGSDLHAAEYQEIIRRDAAGQVLYNLRCGDWENTRERCLRAVRRHIKLERKHGRRESTDTTIDEIQRRAERMDAWDYKF